MRKIAPRTWKWMLGKSREYHEPGISRQEKAAIRQEIQDKAGWHEKSVFRWLGKKPHLRADASQNVGGRPRALNAAAERALVEKWKKMKCPHIEALAKMLPTWLPWAEESSVEEVTPEMKAQLTGVSVSTLKRYIKPHWGEKPDLPAGRRKPVRAKAMGEEIPEKPRFKGDVCPGNCEIDTALHCGTKTDGLYAVTVNCVDVGVGWCGRRTVFGLFADTVVPATMEVLDSWPMPVVEARMDSGAEYINHLMVKELRKRGIEPGRSKPGRPNENPHVEQKNRDHVRRVFGYDRREEEVVAQMNVVNALHTRLTNWYVASSRTVWKKREDGTLVRAGRRTEIPLDSAVAYYEERDEPLPEGLAEQVELRAKTSPFHLRRELDREICRLDTLHKRRRRKNKKKKKKRRIKAAAKKGI